MTGTIKYSYEDATVVVTGASSGIGRAIALAFGEAGATVINGDVRKTPKLDGPPTTEKINRMDGPGRGEYVETDVTDPEQINMLVARGETVGGVDVLVNNAGIFEHASMSELDPEQLQAHLAVNVEGVYYGCKCALATMARHDREGAIINLASIASEVAQGELIHYEATKGAVQMITRGTALEAAEHGIRVNAVAPGVIPTELYDGFSEKYQTEDELTELIKPIPLQRPGDPEEVADAVLFLASQRASYITGETLFVDGGWTAI